MEKATDFVLSDASGNPVRISDLWKQSALLVVFYPGDFTPVCTAQLCDYRDNFSDFKELGVQIVGISADSVGKHTDFKEKYQFPFPLLSDPKQEVVKSYGCTSKWTFGLMNRAVCLINPQGEIVWRYVEPLAVTRRKSGELLEKIRAVLPTKL
jgi:thioredoxin-dependent peroxiredoxin